MAEVGERRPTSCMPNGYIQAKFALKFTAMLDAPSIVRLLLVLTLQGADAWRLPVPGRQRSWTMGHRRSRPRMGTDWRPENLDPLGKAMGQAFGVSQFERTHELWLDLRTSENTFAQM